MKILTLEEVASTNSYVSSRAPELEDGTVVSAVAQTGGRGQRGNSWEAEPGKNLTFSLFLRPGERSLMEGAGSPPRGFRARDQFSLSEAVALAVVDTLGEEGVEARIKWPNDIYVGDRKIAGLLLEHSVTGMNITSTIAGVGLNVNQRAFRSDAPNPVSLFQLTGDERELGPLLERVAGRMERYCREAYGEEGRRRIHGRFLRTLWRGDGCHWPFALPGGEEFEARIAGVEEGGMLLLEKRNGETGRFAFKEVVFRLPDNIPLSESVKKL